MTVFHKRQMRAELSLQQGQQRAAPIERGQLFATADVCITYENLRHRASPSALNHGSTLTRIKIDTNFFDVFDTSLAQQHLGSMAIRADLRGVHLHRAHAERSTGRLASRHAFKPPATACAFSNPCFCNRAAARADCAPVVHITINGRALLEGNCLGNACSEANGMLRAPTAW